MDAIVKAIIEELSGKNVGLDTIKSYVRVAIKICPNVSVDDGAEMVRRIANALPFNPLEPIY